MNFTKWIDTFISEKNIDTETIIEAEGKSGTNFIPVGCIMDYMKSASTTEQKDIKNVLVVIDFKNGDVLHFFKHLAKAIAI